MPEHPEVETVRRGLPTVMEGATIVKAELRRPNLRFPFPDNFQAILEGQLITSLGRRAKYLLVDLANGEVIIMHLGMSGSFRTEDDRLIPNLHHAIKRNEKHDHVVLHLKTKPEIMCALFTMIRGRFGFMLLSKREVLNEHPMFKDLGIEPVGNALDGTELARRVAGKSAPLKAALLDQRIYCRIGQYLCCEALWRCGLSPLRKAGTLTLKSGKPTERANRLAIIIREVINEAIEAGGSSLKDYAQTDGSLGYFQHRFAAYDRAGDPCQKEKCEGTIKRIVQSGRSTFLLP